MIASAVANSLTIIRDFIWESAARFIAFLQKAASFHDSVEIETFRERRTSVQT
jgi:hypothetical protein